MTFKLWKQKYYHRPAEEFRSRYLAVETRELLRATIHSIRKWRGLRLEALEEFELLALYKDQRITDGRAFFYIDGRTCALCWAADENCWECPLFRSLGFTRCDYGHFSPYQIWVETGDPEPMISALEKTFRRLWRRR